LVSELQKKGFENAYALLGGTQAWINAGYPFETKQ
jgi:rhodanese-related sulfurtransferase